MMERDKKAYELAAETVKQILALATAVLALTVTLQKEILPGHLRYTWCILLVSWICFLASIAFGIQTLRWLVTKMYGPDDVRMPAIGDPDIARAAKWHVFSFLAGLIVLILFAMVHIANAAAGPPPTPPVQKQCCCCP